MFSDIIKDIDGDGWMRIQRLEDHHRLREEYIKKVELEAEILLN
jgi:hypothetical protein